MSNRHNENDAARIRSGGTWMYIGGQLMPISLPAIAEQLDKLLPPCLDRLAAELEIRQLADIDELQVNLAPDLTAVTLTMTGHGHTAQETIPLSPPVTN